MGNEVDKGSILFQKRSEEEDEGDEYQINRTEGNRVKRAKRTRNRQLGLNNSHEQIRPKRIDYLSEMRRSRELRSSVRNRVDL